MIQKELLLVDGTSVICYIQAKNAANDVYTPFVAFFISL